MSMINAYDAAAATAVPARERVLIDRRERLLGPAYRLFYANPVHFVRGEGVWLFDPDGQAYLDVYNNVACVGHCNPYVVAAMSRQAATLNTHTRYITDGILDYAERLLDTFPSALDRVMFTCTGSEANDLAYRVACAHTGGTGFIVTSLAYHGVTSVLAGMSPSLGRSVPLGPNVRAIPAPDAYRTGGDPGERFAADIRAAVADLAAHGIRPAALLVDTIFSSDGVLPEPAGFLRPAAAAIREAGGLFIADEVQPGFGRTGAGMWGFARHGLVPDLVTMGKPMGNGHPVAALAARSELLQRFGQSTRYFNTFGGNPVSCAVGQAVLDVIEGESLIQNACDVGAYLKAGLLELAGRHEAIGDVRGAGLFLGLEFVSDRTAKTPAADLAARVVNSLRDRRILVSAAGPFANVLKIRPPLVFRNEHADLLVTALDEILQRST